MLILGHHQNNKMNSMMTFAWCKRGKTDTIKNVCVCSDCMFIGNVYSFAYDVVTLCVSMLKGSMDFIFIFCVLM